MNLTKNERIVLNQIALNLYQPNNGGRPATFEETAPIWSTCLDSTTATEQMTGRALSAVCASLSKKGLIEVRQDKRTKAERGNDIDESTITMTQYGFDTWEAVYPPEAK